VDGALGEGPPSDGVGSLLPVGALLESEPHAEMATTAERRRAIERMSFV
jgi:hypothetical protein